MSTSIPSTMRALALTKHCNPKDYNIATIPTPKITKPDEILIRVQAASVNPIDVKLAGSFGKMIVPPHFPYLVGYDLAGTIVEVGGSVSNLKVGDEVYSRVPEQYRGSIAQYCLSNSVATCLKPKNTSFAEAAAIPLAALTALQCLDVGESVVPGGLKGKTVLIPAGLGGTSSFGVQLAKNCFEAGKVVTTLSTGKIEKISDLLGDGSPDVCVDYTKGSVVEQIGKASVDFMFDTQGYTFSALPVMKKGGEIVSISTIPNGTNFKRKNPGMPLWLEYIMNWIDRAIIAWTSWKGVGYRYYVMRPSAVDLERLKNWVEDGKVKVVMGETAKMENIEDVRAGCQKIFDGKGGIGKFVIEME